MQIEVEKAKKNGYFIKINREQQNRLIHSRYDPEREAEKWWKQLEAQFSGKNVVMLGGGLGYFPELLEKKGINCVVIELLPRFSLPRDCPAAKKRDGTQYLYYDEFKKLETVLKKVDSKNLLGSMPIVHPGYAELFPEVIQQICNQFIQTGRKILRDRQSSRQFFWVWFDNFLENLPDLENMQSIINLRGFLKDSPVILVGAGPTLSADATWLAEIQKKVTIIAVDTSLSTLQAVGVKPDFVLTIDPQAKNAVYLKDVKPTGHLIGAWDARTEYFQWAEANSYPIYVSSNLSGDKAVFPLANWFKTFISGIDFLQSGGSVTSSALDLAQYFQASIIGIVGVDHGFTGMRASPKGSVWEKIQLERLNRFNTLIGAHLERISAARDIGAKKLELVTSRENNKMLTTDEYQNQNAWFEEAGHNLPTTCLDLRRDGLPMKNWQVVDNPLQFFKNKNLKPQLPETEQSISVDWCQFETGTNTLLRLTQKEATSALPTDNNRSSAARLLRESFRPFLNSPDTVGHKSEEIYTDFISKLQTRLKRLKQIIQTKK